MLAAEHLAVEEVAEPPEGLLVRNHLNFFLRINFDQILQVCLHIITLKLIDNNRFTIVMIGEVSVFECSLQIVDGDFYNPQPLFIGEATAARGGEAAVAGLVVAGLVVAAHVIVAARGRAAASRGGNTAARGGAAAARGGAKAACGGAAAACQS